MAHDQLRHHAEQIILDHARDVEFLSVAEYLASEDIEDPNDDTARAIDDLIRTATITVEFPDAPVTPEKTR